MFGFFSDETENGKLYVNYPMVESIRYTKELPDADYYKYEIQLQNVRDFKRLAADFSFYKNLDDICFRVNKNNKLKELSSEQLEKVRRNWKFLVEQNVVKANLVCQGKKAWPKNKADVGQEKLLKGECDGFVNSQGTVSVLNSFPLFLYDYFLRL